MGAIYVPDILEDLSDVPARAGNALKHLRVNAGETALEYAVPSISANFTSVKADFGAVGDNVADDTIPLQNALNAGGIIYLDPGIYRVTSTLNLTVNGTYLFGAGVISEIRTEDVTGDIFSANSVSELTLDNFLVYASVTKTAGYCFNIYQAGRTVIKNMWFAYPGLSDRLYDGIYFNQYDNCLVHNCYFGLLNDGIRCCGNSSGLWGAELTISGKTRMVQVVSKVGNAVHMGGAAGGLYLDSLSISGFDIGVLVDNTLVPGVFNREIFFGPNFVADAGTSVGVKFGSNSITLAQMSGGWLAGYNNCLKVTSVQATNFKLMMSGTRIYRANLTGLYLAAGSAQITGCSIHYNGTNSPYGHGIDLANSALRGVSIVGNHIANNGFSGTGYGVHIAAGVTKMDVSNNMVIDNAAGAIQNLTTPTATEVVKDNII